MIEKLKSDLETYTAELEKLNKQLNSVEESRRAIIKTGTRLEGVVAYLKQTIRNAEAEKDNTPKE